MSHPRWLHLTIGELWEAVLPRSLAPGRQCHCNRTWDNRPLTSIGERCFLLGMLWACITQLTDLSSVSEVELSWELTVVGQPPPGKNVSMEAQNIFGSHYQTTGKHTADWEDLSLCCCGLQSELEIALQFLVVMIHKCLINPVTNPNPIYGHLYTWQCGSVGGSPNCT
jgi:hypothetical protein